MAFAGPAANLIIALVFAILVRNAELLQLSQTFVILAFQIIVLNIFLAFFNLVPIPPLDGSKILPKFLPFSLAMKYENMRRVLEQNVMMAFGIVILVFVFVLAEPIHWVTFELVKILVGF